MKRLPAVAGYFYPGEAEDLAATLDGMIPVVESPVRAKAVISPHAGYVYSGKVAGKVFASVEVPDAVILLGPNHSGNGQRMAVHPAGTWEIPGARVAVDARLVQAIRAACPSVKEDAAAHVREHSLEVQVPFLVRRNRNVGILPLCLMHLTLDECQRLGQAIARVIREAAREVLIVASSDMTHYEPDVVAREQDHRAIEQVIAMDPEGLYRTVAIQGISMCGVIPATVALSACRELGATAARLVAYATSGDTTGDREQVVGYAGMVIE